MRDLKELYAEVILDHYRNPRNDGCLDTPAARCATAWNPVCGDEVMVSVIVRDGCVTDVGFSAQGCSISRSSASMMSVAVERRSPAEIRSLYQALAATVEWPVGADGAPEALAWTGELGELGALRGVARFPVRRECARLGWAALLQCIGDDTP